MPGEVGATRFTPNGTQVPPGSPPRRLPDAPMPPFPSASADLSTFLQAYETADARHRLHGDVHWVPLGMREGKSFEPRSTRATRLESEDRAARLEREVQVLRASMERLQDASFAPGAPASCSKDVPLPPSGLDIIARKGHVGLQGHDLRDLFGDHGGVPGVDHGGAGVCHGNPGRVCPPDQWNSGVRATSPQGLPHCNHEYNGDMGYGRWRGDTGPAAVPLPWNEGSGGSKAELAELSADASPLELGDWLAVCGPVLRDISAVSGRWWHLILTEAQCYYDRWKTASPLERVQITPRLPDELMDARYHRTEQRGVNLLLKAIPVDQQQSLITDRELTPTALLYRLLVRFQPGGAGEKAILLAKLTALDKASGIAEWAAALRSWRRHFARAREIRAILPDGTLLLKALEPAVIHISSLDAQAAF